MTEACGVVGNRDVEPFVPTLIGAMLRPTEASEAIHKLGAVTFVQASPWVTIRGRGSVFRLGTVWFVSIGSNVALAGSGCHSLVRAAVTPCHRMSGIPPRSCDRLTNRCTGSAVAFYVQ